MWLANNAAADATDPRNTDADAEQPAGGAGAASAAAQLTPDELLRFQRVAAKLLGLNRCALAALLEQPPQLDAQRHAAQTLWRSLPQAPSVPAVRPVAMPIDDFI